MSYFKKGDTVQVVKPTLCCKDDTMVDYIFVIETIEDTRLWSKLATCAYCGEETNTYVATCKINGLKRSFVLERLKKFDAPLEDNALDVFENKELENVND